MQENVQGEITTIAFIVTVYLLIIINIQKQNKLCLRAFENIVFQSIFNQINYIHSKFSMMNTIWVIAIIFENFNSSKIWKFINYPIRYMFRRLRKKGRLINIYICKDWFTINILGNLIKIFPRLSNFI